MKAIIWLTVICFGALAVFDNAQEKQPENKSIGTSTKKLLTDIGTIDGCQSIERHNSRVVITTPAIEQIVNGGIDSLDVLISAMKDKAASFDTFARCYSACDQILRKIDPKYGVIWYGSCRINGESGWSRLFPMGQMNEVTFRQEMIRDVEVKRCLAKARNPSLKGHWQ